MQLGAVWNSEPRGRAPIVLFEWVVWVGAWLRPHHVTVFDMAEELAEVRELLP